VRAACRLFHAPPSPHVRGGPRPVAAAVSLLCHLPPLPSPASAISRLCCLPTLSYSGVPLPTGRSPYASGGPGLGTTTDGVVASEPACVWSKGGRWRWVRALGQDEGRAGGGWLGPAMEVDLGCNLGLASSLAWLGLAWLGLAWLGLAWLGLAWLGLAWLGLAWLALRPRLGGGGGGNGAEDGTRARAPEHQPEATRPRAASAAALGRGGGWQGPGLLMMRSTPLRVCPQFSSWRSQPDHVA